MSEIFNSCVIIFIIVFWVVSDMRKEKIRQKERQDMLDRFMSRDLSEYKHHTEPVKLHDPVILTEEEEWAREIEQMKSG